jgi:hypothetical protein
LEDFPQAIQECWAWTVVESSVRAGGIEAKPTEVNIIYSPEITGEVPAITQATPQVSIER